MDDLDPKMKPRYDGEGNLMRPNLPYQREEYRVAPTSEEAVQAQEYIQRVPKKSEIILTDDPAYLARVRSLSNIERFVLCQDAALSSFGRDYQKTRISQAYMFYMTGRLPSLLNITWIDMLTELKLDLAHAVKHARRQRIEDERRKFLAEKDDYPAKKAGGGIKAYVNLLRQIGFDPNECREAMSELNQIQASLAEPTIGDRSLYSPD
ncbi:MAG: hypothetical protein OXG25_01125 [Gammaproteobacteria bacterium]|nr:hypothetical protein [Gammaproteobacteria bacterium]